jgi:hypothetical protein
VQTLQAAMPFAVAEPVLPYTDRFVELTGAVHETLKPHDAPHATGALFVTDFVTLIEPVPPGASQTGGTVTHCPPCSTVPSGQTH